jgi:O-methyltransferase
MNKKAIRIAAPYSKCSQERLRVIAKSIEKIDAEGIEGDIVECGVWKGGVVILARLLSPNRKVWLYDTFNGMANLSEFDTTKDGYVMPEGKAAVSQYEVARNLAETYTLHHDRIRFVEGRVEDTLLDRNNLPEKIALLHLDTDWYHSTKIELIVLWPRLTKGGVLIVDDYGHWKGSRKAVEEYFPPVERNIIHIDKTAIMMVKSQ